MPKPNYSGSGFSGEDRRVYEDGDQRNVPNSTLADLNRTHPGNFLEATTRDPQRRTQLVNETIEKDRQATGEYTEAKIGQRDPTAPAIMHGNQPSKGARIDKELQEEDAAILKKKGDAMPGKKY